MLGLVEVAVGNIGIVLQARHRKQIVAIGSLPHIDEIGQLLAMVPQVARTDLESARCPVMRMAGDAQCTLSANLTKNRIGRLIRADVLLDVQRDDV